MTLVREGMIIIDDGDSTDANHASANLDHKKDSISEALGPMHPVALPKIEEGIIILLFGSFEPVEFPALKKTTNTSKLHDFSNDKQ